MPTVIRTTHDGSQFIVRSDSGYMLFDTKSSQIVDDSQSLVSMLATRNDWITPKTREAIEIMPLVASGMSTFKRKKKAEDQPRDGHGRWVSAGANVRWAADGQQWAGTVEKIENGKAIVKVRHKDGSHSMTTLLPNTLRVMASKARLGSAAKKYHDWQNKSDRYIGEHAGELAEAAAEGGALIEREDGYAIEMKEKKPKDTDNPVMYQLYAPGGRSLGIYDDQVVGDIDGMFEADAGGGPAPADGGGASEGGVVAAGYNRPYSVPKAVREAVDAALSSKIDIPETFRAKAQALASGEQVGIDEVKFVHGFFSSIAEDEDLYGGYAGRKWAGKIMEKVEADEPSIFESVKHDFTSESLEYFAVSGNGTTFDSLIAVDFDKDEVHCFDGLDFTIPAGSANDYDAKYIEPLDNFTASVVAEMLHEDSLEGGPHEEFSTLDIFPEERNLFALAESAMDFGFLSEVAQLSNEDYKKSVNAQGQARGEAGKFGQPNTTQVTGATVDGAPEADAGASVDQASQQAEGAADPMSVAKYFAIVDEIDQSAVLDIVAVTNVGGAPAAFKRTQASWVADSEYLTKLQGATPPTIVALDTEDEVKDVLTQVDAYDSGEDEEALAASAAHRGFAMADGSFRILSVEDLHDVVNEAVASNRSKAEVDHIVKRARALNRIDLVPEDWRVLSGLRGPRDLVGEFGEVIVAAGVPGIADTASDHESVQRLKNYWKYGPGASKIKWGSEGDLTRAHKHLAKYVGTENAWGLAQVLHMELFGESNYKKDNG